MSQLRAGNRSSSCHYAWPCMGSSPERLFAPTPPCRQRTWHARTKNVAVAQLGRACDIGNIFLDGRVLTRERASGGEFNTSGQLHNVNDRSAAALPRRQSSSIQTLWYTMMMLLPHRRTTPYISGTNGPILQPLVSKHRMSNVFKCHAVQTALGDDKLTNDFEIRFNIADVDGCAFWVNGANSNVMSQLH
jgi:hypothetical protein